MSERFAKYSRITGIAASRRQSVPHDHHLLAVS
jgi:hypothetical protein